MRKILTALLVFFLCISATETRAYVNVSTGFSLPSFSAEDSLTRAIAEVERLLADHPATLAFVKEHAENKKLVALVLTATLGMLGVHRLYLGTKPWIPAIYLFTFGGCFFILPFIDFVVLLISKDISRFENNNKVFMWAN